MPASSHPSTQTGSIHDGRRVWPKGAFPKSIWRKQLFKEFHGPGGDSERPPGKWQCLAEFGDSHWLGGSYWASFTADESGTTIIRVEVNQDQLSWSISSPRSLWYPGTHSGMIPPEKDYPFKPPEVRFSTRIFSPYVNRGRTCLGITSGEYWKVNTSFLEILYAVAIMLMFPPLYDMGEYFRQPLPGFIPHGVISGSIELYINKDKDAFLRATNFFSRAFAQDMADSKNNREVMQDEVKVTVLTIMELLDYFAGSNASGVLPKGFSKSTVKSAFERVRTLHSLLTEEKRWASAVESICY